MPTLNEIGHAVTTRRVEMGLTQSALARISAMSRSTINALETQSLRNLSILKAEALLESIGLSMHVEAHGMTPTPAAGRAPPGRSALERAAATASTSYRDAMTASQLEAALLSGAVADRIKPHLQALLDDAPISLLAKVVEELHVEKGVTRMQIWHQMRRHARALKCFRPIWR